jgi:hypothetical protein
MGQVNVKVGSKAVPVRVREGERVLDVMERIEDQEGIPVSQQRIVYAGQELDRDQQVEDLRIQPAVREMVCK